MNVITVSRQYGAGGGEVARRLAEALGWELLDRELLHQAAAIEEVPDAELERLDEKALSMTDRFRLHPPHQRYMHGLTEAARQAAARGNVVLVGRGTRQLLGDMPDVFHLRLMRRRFHESCFGADWADPLEYHLTVNSGRLGPAAVDLVAAAAARYWAIHFD